MKPRISEWTRRLRDAITTDVGLLVGPIVEVLEVAGEPYESTRAGLLDQLRDALTTPVTGDGGPFVASSKPPIFLECEATLSRISATLSRLLAECHAASLSQLVSLLSVYPDDRLQYIARVVESCRIQATAVSPWEAERIRPMVPCPREDCGAVSSVVVLVSDRSRAVGPGGVYLGAPLEAACTRCAYAWPREEWPELLTWIRWAGDHLPGPAHMVPGPAGLTECTECAAVRARLGDLKRRLGGARTAEPAA